MSEQQKRGPKPEHVKIDEDWEEAMTKALKKKRPEGGWPESEKEQKSPPDKSPK